MTLINYDVNVNPPKPTVTLGISTELKPSATDSNQPQDLWITVAVENIDLSVSVKPETGTVVGGAIAGFLLGPFGSALTVASLYGVGEFIQQQLDSQIPKGIKGKKKEQNLGSLGYTINVEGVDIKIEAKTLQLSTYDGMLMATGSVQVS